MARQPPPWDEDRARIPALAELVLPLARHVATQDAVKARKLLEEGLRNAQRWVETALHATTDQAVIDALNHLDGLLAEVAGEVLRQCPPLKHPPLRPRA